MQNQTDEVFEAVKRYEPNSKKARKKLAGAASIGSSAGDAFEKVNYLTQAAHLMCQQVPQCPELGRYYVYNSLQICRKLCLKISPEMKQLWCKYCFTFFIPFKNCSVKIEKKRKQKFCAIKCLSCGRPKRYPIEEKIEKSKRKRRGAGSSSAEKIQTSATRDNNPKIQRSSVAEKSLETVDKTGMSRPETNT